MQIIVTYLDGPFSRMENRWRFTPKSEDSSEVEFSIDYEFKSRMLGMLMGTDVRRRIPKVFRGVRGPRAMKSTASEPSKIHEPLQRPSELKRAFC